MTRMSLAVEWPVNTTSPALTVIEIGIRNWLAVFLKMGHFVGYLMAFPLKMHSKFGRPK